MKFSTCTQNVITGNEIQYKLEPSICPNHFIFDTTGIELIYNQVPLGAGGQIYVPNSFFSVTTRGVALWAADSPTTTVRTLLHVWDPFEIDTHPTIDYTDIVKAHGASGNVRRLFFTVLGSFGNGDLPLYELPTIPHIISSFGDITLSNQDNVDASAYTFMFCETFPGEHLVRTMKNMGVVRSGNCLTDSVTHSLDVFLPPLPLTP
jgi:hypothetical protein